MANSLPPRPAEHTESPYRRRPPGAGSTALLPRAPSNPPGAGSTALPWKLNSDIVVGLEHELAQPGDHHLKEVYI